MKRLLHTIRTRLFEIKKQRQQQRMHDEGRQLRLVHNKPSSFLFPVTFLCKYSTITLREVSTQMSHIQNTKNLNSAAVVLKRTNTILRHYF